MIKNNKGKIISRSVSLANLTKGYSFKRERERYNGVPLSNLKRNLYGDKIRSLCRKDQCL